MVFRSSVPLSWRLKKSKYALIGSQCDNCRDVFFPPRSFCPNCRRKGNMVDFKFSGKGEIVSFTVIRVPPEGFEAHGPYTVAIVKLAEGPSISAQIADEEERIDIGKKVEPVFRKIYEDGAAGLINYGMKFKISD